ncbi:serine/threonine protein phosphatase [Parapedobacter sp. SGR-10]|uniref:metallophosphoesterase n=1 Tax=Parapedobacter sp. SGR-10 TaxID=2710879 RepID=UPI0013D069B2|nr:metallophosphoesterase [Parapedobacter sp. SGR-10]NGF56885.1 serine/threonine protein phosphatase [Parapedobacter sp. SGR-10]
MIRKFLFTLIGIICAASILPAQQKFQKPTLENKDSWSVVMIPDIQNYVKWNRNQPILDLMMRWIEDNIDTLHIKMVVCVGDLVEHNNLINQGHDGDQSAQRQWETSAKLFSRLNGKVPYIAASGNHDYTIDRQGNRTSRYTEFFRIDDNWLNKKTLVQNATNEQGVHTLENAAYEIKTPQGKDYLFLTIEYAPRDTMVAWAKRIADMQQYKDHRIVLITHAYLNAKDHRTTGVPKWFVYEPYTVNTVVQKSERINLPYANSGEQIWEKLIHPGSNIELVLCGHISGEGYRMDKNTTGRPVHQMLFDSQSLGGGHRNGNGGDGWLRILEFLPDNKTVNVKTFSPLFAISPTTQQHAWKTDARNSFSFQFAE